MTVTLTADVEQALLERARERGTTAEMLALESWCERFLPSDEPNPADGFDTLADFLEGHVGLLNSSEHVPGRARMSEDGGRKFAAGMVRKRQAGRL